MCGVGVRAVVRPLFFISFSSLLTVIALSSNPQSLATTPMAFEQPRPAMSYQNASNLLSNLLSDYDIRLRPGFGGDALLLTMDIIIASFDAISEVDMDYTVTMYLHQYWTDERLSWTEEVQIDDMTLSGDFSAHIWVPDTFLANDKHSYLHDVTERNKMLRITRDGRVAYGMRFTSTLACSMDLRNFPLDAQNCTVEIESYGYTTSEVLMKWNEPLAVHGVEQSDVPQFEILGYQTEDSIVSTATGSYQRLSLVFQLKRNVGYFIFQTYLPCILIVMLSWVSFWINHEATSARVALGITTVLTMTTISTGVRQSLPRISYVKSIDIYLVMCFVFVFAALLEYAAVNYSYWGRKQRRGSAMRGGEDWPRAVSNGDTRTEDTEGAVNPRDFGVPKSFIDEISDRRLKSVDVEAPRPSSSENSSKPSSLAVRKRPSSPLPSLYPESASAVEQQDDETPDYPRIHAGQLRIRNSSGGVSRLRHRMSLAKANSLKHSIYKISKRAKSAIPKFRVRDVNVIDRYSRIIFPMCFIIFNIFYWGYYSMQ